MENTQFEKVPSNVQEMPEQHQWRTRVNDTVNQVSHRAREYAQYANRTVHDNPWTSVGTAFGAGIAIGALVALAIMPRRD